MGMRLWINGTEQSNFIIDTPFKDTIDEELDNLNFQIKSTTRRNINKFDKVMYWIGHGSTVALNKKMAIFNVVETWEGEKWLYQIECLSPTKILENIIINGMAETYVNEIGGIIVNRLYDQIVRVKDKINAQLDLEGVGLTITLGNSFSSVNQNQAISDFLWDGQVNAREIFNDMLDKADSLVVATDYTLNNGNITAITIEAVKREKKGTQLINSANDIDNGGLNDVKEMVKGITFNRNSEFACGNIISLTKNAIAKDNIQQTYTPARNTDLTIDDTKEWHIITQEPIYSLNKVVVLIPARVNYYYLTKNANDEWQNTFWNEYVLRLMIPIDITDYIVEKSVFDTMSLSDQSKKLYFIRGQKGIYNLYNRYKSGLTGLFSNTALDNIIKDNTSTQIKAQQLVDTYINNNGVVNFETYGYDKLLKYSSGDIIPYSNVVGTINIHISLTGNKELGAISSFVVDNDGMAVDTDLQKKCLFSVNYQPYCDSVVKIEKSSLDCNGKNLCVLKNQSDRTIDATKYYDSQKALIERMGNKEMFMDCMIDLTTTYSHLKSLWDLGDYMTLNGTNWTITQRTLENYNENKLKVRYTLSKEFNASNVDIQVNRDKRLYGIPLDNYVNRYIIIKLGNQQSLYKKLAIKCYDDFTNNTTTTGYSLMELVAIGNNDITDKVARCMDNYAVDIERTKYSSTIVNVYLRYGDSDGFAEDIELMLISDAYWGTIQQAGLITDYSRLPFIAGTTIQAYGTYKKLTGIKKDKMERLIFVFKE